MKKEDDRLLDNISAKMNSPDIIRRLLFSAPGWALFGMFAFWVLFTSFGSEYQPLNALIFIMAILGGFVLNLLEVSTGFWSENRIGLKMTVLCGSYWVILILIFAIFGWLDSAYGLLQGVDVEGSILMTALPFAGGYTILGFLVGVIFSLMGD